MSAAPARRAPCTAESPTAPQPMTITQSARPIRATFKRCTDARHHSASDQAGAVERDLVSDRDRLLLLHDAVFAEGAEEHQMLELAPISEPGLAFLRRTQPRCGPSRKVIRAQDRPRGRSRSNGRNADSTTGPHDRPCGRWRPPAHLLHHARGFVPEQDRHGIAQRALDHFQVGVAEPGGAHTHQDVGPPQWRRADAFDRERGAGAMQHRGIILQGHDCTSIYLPRKGRSASAVDLPFQGEIWSPAPPQSHVTSSGRLSSPRLRGRSTWIRP